MMFCRRKQTKLTYGVGGEEDGSGEGAGHRNVTQKQRRIKTDRVLMLTVIENLWKIRHAIQSCLLTSIYLPIRVFIGTRYDEQKLY
jgi:hypothetical protein